VTDSPFFPKPASTEALLLTARQAAAALAISERTLYTLTKRGELPAVRIGAAVRYDRRDVQALIERLKGPARAQEGGR
jgi:excisionase family DNA binding protein